MDGHNLNREFSYTNLSENDSLRNSQNIEKQREKEDNLQKDSYDNASGYPNRDYDNNNTNNYKEKCSSLTNGDNLERDEVKNINDEVESEDHNNINCESSVVADYVVNNYDQLNRKMNNIQHNEKSKDVNAASFKILSSHSTSSATFAEAQSIAKAHVKNITQQINRRYLVKDFGDQILHGQQINVHNHLDDDGSLCAPFGVLCDMSAFSKFDFSLLGDSEDHNQNHKEFLPKKYYHPLFSHGICRWPGCELPLDDMAVFVKHLKSEHCLDDRSTAQARVQMQVVSQLEMHLQKERERLQAMMHHLYLKKHFVMPEESQENISQFRYKNAIRSVSTTPDLIKNSSNDDSNGASDLQSLLINSGNIIAARKRICEKSPLALAGGLPYMLERAGLDVQQEIQRNREFYKNADVRPPFTYASLIRQNAIRTNLSLHKCFVRYEDDFGSFWMVDDSEFVKRRHLSRGRPRKYEPSSSPNSNSQQFGSTFATKTSSDVVDGISAVNNNKMVGNNSPDSSAAGSSSRQRSASSGSKLYPRSGHKNHVKENSGDNDVYDICEVSQRSPAGYQNHLNSGRKQYCGSKQRPHLQGSIIGIAIKTNVNSLIDHNDIANKPPVDDGVAAMGNEPGVSGIGDSGSVGSVDVDSHHISLNVDNTGVETEDPNGYDFHRISISSEAISNSPSGSKNNMGRYSPNIQNMWSFGSSLNDEVTPAEFACINNDRYRNFVAGLHLQSLTQRHQIHQHKPATHRMDLKTQQQLGIRSNVSHTNDVRSLHQQYNIYSTNPEQQSQQLGADIFGINAILNTTDKYFSNNNECPNEFESFKHESFKARQQQHLSINHHPYNFQTELSAEEISNQLYIHHHNLRELDVKYSPHSFDTRTLSRADDNFKKRPADDIYSNQTSDTTEEDSGIVAGDREEVVRKRKKNHMSSRDFEEVEIKAEADSESELRNLDIPLRTKSY